MTDLDDAKLEIAASLEPITPIDVTKTDPAGEILRSTDGWGVEIVFEAAGAPRPRRRSSSRSASGAVSS